MIRAKLSICATAVLSFTALAWFLPDLQVSAAAGTDRLGRSIGAALLGGAMIAAGLAFRWALTEPKTPPALPRRMTGEFRRGFGERQKPRLATPPARPPVPPGVITLRQAILTEASKPRMPVREAMPAADIKRLQDLLQSRVVQLGAYRTAPARPHALRSVTELQDRPRS